MGASTEGLTAITSFKGCLNEKDGFVATNNSKILVIETYETYANSTSRQETRRYYYARSYGLIKLSKIENGSETTILNFSADTSGKENYAEAQDEYCTIDPKVTW